MAILPAWFQIESAAVILISGPSGSGKSSLINTLLQDRPDLPLPSLRLADRSRPIIEAWNISPAQAARRLTHAGLADPFTWARTPAELSVGQRTRFDLLDLLYGTSKLIVVDDFLATLDRTTAKAVAWSIGKLARYLDVVLIAATASDDLAADLQPDMNVRLGWTPEPEFVSLQTTRAHPTFWEDLEYRPGRRHDWNQLKHLHYAAGDPPTVHSYHVLELPTLDHPAAVAILSYPDLHSAARNIATDDRYRVKGSRTIAQRLNREVLRLSRIVVSPEVRSCGLATFLVRCLLQDTNLCYLECTATMGRYTRFLENSGFREIPQMTGPPEANLFDWAERALLPPHAALDPELLETFVDSMTVRQRREARRICWRYFHHFVLHRRTHGKQPKKIPDPTNPHWPRVWSLVATRLTERPSFWIIGPLRTPAEETPQCSTEQTSCSHGPLADKPRSPATI